MPDDSIGELAAQMADAVIAARQHLEAVLELVEGGTAYVDALPDQVSISVLPERVTFAYPTLRLLLAVLCDGTVIRAIDDGEPTAYVESFWPDGRRHTSGRQPLPADGLWN